MGNEAIGKGLRLIVYLRSFTHDCVSDVTRNGGTGWWSMGSCRVEVDVTFWGFWSGDKIFEKVFGGAAKNTLALICWCLIC